MSNSNQCTRKQLGKKSFFMPKSHPHYGASSDNIQVAKHFFEPFINTHMQEIIFTASSEITKLHVLFRSKVSNSSSLVCLQSDGDQWDVGNQLAMLVGAPSCVHFREDSMMIHHMKQWILCAVLAPTMEDQNLHSMLTLVMRNQKNDVGIAWNIQWNCHDFWVAQFQLLAWRETQLMHFVWPTDGLWLKMYNEPFDKSDGGSGFYWSSSSLVIPFVE